MAGEDALRAVAALGEERRRALFEFVRGAGRPVGRDEAAEATGMSRAAASAHLDRLVDDGVLAHGFSKPPERSGPGSGRPSKVYWAALDEVSASVPPRSYDLAGSILAEAAQRAISGGSSIAEAIRAAALDRGRLLGGDHGRPEDALESVGYEPVADEGGIRLGSCPFHRLSRECPDVVCALNGALLQGVLEGCGDHAHRVEAEPDGECCARLARG
ncbi:helix-turn-helix transcriptional regulator [Sinomonas mesophila]|uniref:helix-turn-helix transcriptional regulator n=1 Tax=Sinomonas mesophila TaxID=1531955 RepID=UPI0009845C82|nr:hypothetical protein [Sinomonas mesophila]